MSTAHLKTRFNPFNRLYEVYELKNYNNEVKYVKVLHEFEQLHDAVECKKTKEKHNKMFKYKDLEEV